MRKIWYTKTRRWLVLGGCKNGRKAPLRQNARGSFLSFRLRIRAYFPFLSVLDFFSAFFSLFASAGLAGAAGLAASFAAAFSLTAGAAAFSLTAGAAAFSFTAGAAAFSLTAGAGAFSFNPRLYSTAELKHFAAQVKALKAGDTNGQ